MGFWRDRVKPDVRGHSGLLGNLNSMGLIKAGVITVLFAAIVILPSVKATADSVYKWLYDVKMTYSKENITLNLSLEDISAVPIDKNMGTVLFILDTYLKDSDKPDGKWQMDVNVREADIIQIGTLDFSQSSTPSKRFDITDIYYNTNAFYRTCFP